MITTNYANESILISELTYSCYKHNRGLAPEVSPERWAKILSNVPAMEERYQSEQREEQSEYARKWYAENDPEPHCYGCATMRHPCIDDRA